MVEPISTCQIDTNKVTWYCLSFPWFLPMSHSIIKAKIIEIQKRVKKLPQRVTILFGLLLNGFWFISYDPGFILKPWCHSSLHNYTRSPAYVSISYYIDLPKMSKHWSSFLSHCRHLYHRQEAAVPCKWAWATSAGSSYHQAQANWKLFHPKLAAQACLKTKTLSVHRV